MKRQKISALFATVLIFVLVFSACGKPADTADNSESTTTVFNDATVSTTEGNTDTDTNTGTDTDANGSKNQNSNTDTRKTTVRADTSATQQTSPNGSRTTAKTTKKATASSGKERFVTALAARYSADENKGYSMWSKSGLYYCVNFDGYVTFQCEQSEKPITNVYNNAVLTQLNNTYKLRQASSGAVLFSNTSIQNSTILLPVNGEDAMFKDGYALVYTKSESYNGVSYQLGFINSSGKWVSNLSSANPILKTLGDSASHSFFEKQLHYCDEGILAFMHNDKGYLYNIKTNTIATIQTNANLTSTHVKSIISCDMEFKNGVSAQSYNFGGRYCKIFSNGKVEILPLNFHDDLHEEEGSKYYDAKKNAVVTMGYTYHVSRYSVFDSLGTIRNKIENVTVTSVNGFKSDGTAQIVFENKEGSKYYTVIDSNGKFLFEPIKMSVNEIWDLSAYSVDCIETYAVRQGTYAVVDNTGKVLLTTEHVYDFGVNNGVARYEKNNQTYYIDLYA